MNNIERRRDEAARLYDDGRSVRHIATLLGVSVQTVYSYLRARDRELRPGSGSVDQAQVERICALHRDHGWTYADIASVLGLSISSIQRRMRRSGREGIRRWRVSPDEEQRIIDRRRKAARFYEKGETLGVIAYRLDVSRQTIFEDLRKAGVIRRGNKGHPWRVRQAAEIDEMVRLRESRYNAAS